MKHGHFKYPCILVLDTLQTLTCLSQCLGHAVDYFLVVRQTSDTHLTRHKGHVPSSNIYSLLLECQAKIPPESIQDLYNISCLIVKPRSLQYLLLGSQAKISPGSSQDLQNIITCTTSITTLTQIHQMSCQLITNYPLVGDCFNMVAAELLIF